MPSNCYRKVCFMWGNIKNLIIFNDGSVQTFKSMKVVINPTVAQPIQNRKPLTSMVQEPQRVFNPQEYIYIAAMLTGAVAFRFRQATSQSCKVFS